MFCHSCLGFSVVRASPVVEASPRRICANGQTYLINSIFVNSDAETYLSADDFLIKMLIKTISVST